jgi:hypothetical protein
VSQRGGCPSSHLLFWGVSQFSTFCGWWTKGKYKTWEATHAMNRLVFW